ncbi:MAG: GNAT family N-acetyltransferase [Sedimenticola sp.]
MSPAVETSICSNLDEIDPREWNGLVEDNNPFLSHEFLVALERHHCAAPVYGWHPRHLLLHSRGRLLGAAPLYLKENSYGEFVFDHAWADAYQRNRLAYYPKLVSSIPYTPATGKRLLLAEGRDNPSTWATVSSAVKTLATGEGCSSVHWLFLQADEERALREQGWMTRKGVQFHWYNRGYDDFDSFLGQLNSKRRKNIRRERRLASGHGLQIRVLHGNEASQEQWRIFSRFYAKTFEERYSMPTLNLGFFSEVAESLGERVVLVLAYEGERCVAGALMYRSDDTLYGRHWGCEEDYDSLHFELCYYQGIDYCIRNGLRRFEPGAQGEHKIWRGFLPTTTYSSHWIAEPAFNSAIEDFLRREERAMADYRANLELSSPYRQG